MTYPPVDHNRSRRRSAGSILALGAAGCGGTIVVGLVALMVALSTTDFGGCDLDTTSSSPGDGAASQRLKVDVSPREDLTDRATVEVTSDAFEPNRVVGVAVCLREADLDHEGVEACDTTNGYRYATDRTGHLRAAFPVPRVITVGDKAYDCARTTSRCIVVAADASDFDRSGGQTIAFRPGLPDAALRPSGPRPATDDLPVSGTPASPVADGAAVTVSAMGFQPGEPLLVARCAGFPQVGVVEACEPLDSSAALVAVMGRSTGSVRQFAAADSTFAVSVEARRTIRPYGASDADAPVTCDSPEAGCAIVVAAAADTRRSAVLPYWVA